MAQSLDDLLREADESQRRAFNSLPPHEQSKAGTTFMEAGHISPLGKWRTELGLDVTALRLIVTLGWRCSCY